MRSGFLGLTLFAVVLPAVCMAGGFASTFRLDRGVVAVTNVQANSSWATVAVLVRFDAGTNGTLSIRRVSQGNTYTLGTCTFAVATNLVWAAERDYSFGFGDVLLIESTATNGVVQVMLKND
jgi:hypothetical protein